MKIDDENHYGYFTDTSSGKKKTDCCHCSDNLCMSHRYNKWGEIDCSVILGWYQVRYCAFCGIAEYKALEKI